MGDHPFVEARDLHLHYGPTVAVDGVDLAVHSGEVLALVGHNGAGKTSTIRMLTGMTAPTAGDVLVAGERLHRDRLHLRREIGYVPDHPAIFEHLTGREYVRFVCGLYGMSATAADGAAAPYFRRFNLEGREDDLLESYSHGMRQKAVLVATLSHDPGFLVLDEPIVGLDPHAGRELRRILRERAAAGTAIMFSSHVLAVAADVADRVAIVHQGRILVAGTISDLLSAAPGAASLEDAFFHLTGTQAAA